MLLGQVSKAGPDVLRGSWAGRGEGLEPRQGGFSAEGVFEGNSSATVFRENKAGERTVRGQKAVLRSQLL